MIYGIKKVLTLTVAYLSNGTVWCFYLFTFTVLDASSVKDSEQLLHYFDLFQSATVCFNFQSLYFNMRVYVLYVLYLVDQAGFYVPLDTI